VSRDGVRHFAYGAGDDNPLWCDPEYGQSTRWGGLIAPPLFFQTMGVDDVPPMTPEIRAIAGRDPLAGVFVYQSGMEFEWWRPLRLGDRTRQRSIYVGVRPKESEFGGRTVHETIANLHRNQQDELVTMRRATFVRAERETKKERSFDLAEPYTQEQLNEIDATYESERRRGGDPLYFEDVTLGQEFQPRVKGPFQVTDAVRWHMGFGMAITPLGSYRLSYLVRRKVPELFSPDALNVPDTVQRVHWDQQWTSRLGIARTYDYGTLRETWLTMAICDWAGDAAWLWKLSCQHRRFNFMGDTTWVKGRVVGKEVTDRGNEMHLEVWCENQFGKITTPGEAVVLLPSRDQSVSLPLPPVEGFDEMLEYEVSRNAE
jgi:acyl dehydratase